MFMKRPREARGCKRDGFQGSVTRGTGRATASAGACAGTPIIDCQDICGDVDGSGAVGITDALTAAQFQVGLRTCGQVPRFDLCDISPSGSDGSCSIADALRMAQCSVGLIPCTFTCTLLTCQ